MKTISLVRIYSKEQTSPAYRVLVDRIWPRGISKADAQLDLWLKEIAPSTQLRKWFNHDITKREEFQKLYTEELTHHTDLIEQLLGILEKHTIALLYGAKDSQHNQAVVIKDFLEKQR